MPEIIDGFTVWRSSAEVGEGKFHPCIDAEITLPDGRTLRGFRHIHLEGEFPTREAAELAAARVEVCEIVHNGRTVIIQVDAI